MEVKRSILQVYAMIISTVAVITFLIAVGNMISACIDRADPLYAGRYDQNLTSFEHFKMEALRSVNKEQIYIPDDQALMSMYEAAKDEKVKLVYHQSRKTLIVNAILLAVSLVLFGTHWRWIREKYSGEAGQP